MKLYLNVPKHNDLRKLKRFAFFPKRIGKDGRMIVWLEFYYKVQLYRSKSEGYSGEWWDLYVTLNDEEPQYE